MEMGNENIEDLQKKAAIFFNNEIPVHIVTTQDDWYNGYIKEYSAEFIIVIDRKHGESFIFFKDIHILEQFRGDYSTLKRGDNNDKRNG